MEYMCMRDQRLKKNILTIPLPVGCTFFFTFIVIITIHSTILFVFR
jgi:hypothetical protein